MKYLALAPLFFFLAVSCAVGQDHDFCLWNSWSLEGSLGKKWEISWDEEFRLKDNALAPDLHYSSVGITFKINKMWKAGLKYRFSQKFRTGGVPGLRNRLILDVSFRKKTGIFQLGWRSRFFMDIARARSSESGNLPAWMWANKLEIKYPVRDFTPFAGGELYFSFYDPDNPDGDFRISRFRAFAGLEYRISKGNTLGTYYMFQRNLFDSNPSWQHILGIQYTLGFEMLRSGKKSNKSQK